MEFYDTIIIGGGAAAYSAGMYASRYEMKTLLIEGEFGGETAVAATIENYPGFKAIDGFDLMEKMKDHAVSTGVKVVQGKAELVSNAIHCFRVQVGETIYEGKTLILATGSERRTLNLPNEKEFKQRGVHYCVTCDGPLFRGKRVAIVGGGDAAVKGANQLADTAAEIFVIVRETNINRAEPINRDRLLSRKNVHILYSTEITELHGTNRLAQITLSKPYNGSPALPLDALFVAIGATPRTDLAKKLGVALDAQGYVDVDPRTMKTNIDGVFAAGDVTNASGAFKQIVTGAAQGSIAATSAYQDLGEHG
ncbi:FAD-dependent oxidoreductase, partial [Candidatus Uhrbacteria bacterium]|nr:FAD-dependent oxidoreductase [Candidatus Uhrbacteria bacterium]